ncbi:MAG: sensor histidine kinase [Schleiferilactobacillus perolens]|uniref:sensor histidine kinase n=1 Tax=Schleiferilactobacillus perolens TaxID=100468 RepID=UPI0039ED64DA
MAAPKKRRPYNRHMSRVIGYVWLLYFPYSIISYLPPKRPSDYLWLSVAGVFLVSYILVMERPNTWRFSIPIEVLACALFAIFAQGFYLLIFPGWQVASILSNYPKRQFAVFLVAYYGALIGGIAMLYWQYTTINWGDGAAWGMIFPTISPIFSYSFSKSVSRSIRLAQSNSRLEAVVRRGERERIARDLHDNLGQSFSMITVKAQLAEKLLEKQPEKAVGELQDIADTSRENLQLVRNIVNDLRQESLADVLLAQEKNLREARISLYTEGEELADDWPTACQVTLAAVLQEAITNVIRHSQARQVTVTFTATNAQYIMTVQDNGVGKDYHRTNSHGVSGMLERVEQVGGTLKIVANQIGTLVTATLPRKEVETK